MIPVIGDFVPFPMKTKEDQLLSLNDCDWSSLLHNSTVQNIRGHSSTDSFLNSSEVDTWFSFGTDNVGSFPGNVVQVSLLASLMVTKGLLVNCSPP
jgi:hypothetical protein